MMAAPWKILRGSSSGRVSNSRAALRILASALDEIRVGRLFDRFYTVESASADSTGLGLSIAKVLTEQMGGEISAEYEDGMIRVKLSFPKTCFV